MNEIAVFLVTQDLELRARRLKEKLDVYRQSPNHLPTSDTEISYRPRDDYNDTRIEKSNHIDTRKLQGSKNVNPRNKALIGGLYLKSVAII